MKLKEKLPPLPPEIEHYLTKVLPTMGGWMTEIKGRALARSVLRTKPAWAVEIGVFAGRSLITIALALKHLNEGGLCSGIDPWTKEESTKGFEGDKPNFDWWHALDHSRFLKETQDSIKQMGVQDFTSLIVDTSEGALNRTKEIFGDNTLPNIDLLHIDGNHSVESALFDINGWVPMVKPGCEVWLDDLNWLSTKQAQLRILDFCDLIEVISDCGVYRKR